MTGDAFFFAFATVTFPIACVALIALRRQVQLWLWLERQWKERQAIVVARSPKRKRPHQAEQVLLFPELARRDREEAAIAVNDWSTHAPREKAAAL
jgi:hypothetical protein